MTPLHSRIAAQFVQNPDGIAIEPFDPARDPITYARLRGMITAVQDTMPGDSNVIGILSNQTPEAYVAAAAAFLRGVTFVPLNPKFPVERLRTVVSLAGISSALTDRDTAVLAPEIGCESVDVSGIVDPPVGAQTAESHDGQPQVEVIPENSVAYQMFTSGSTGLPKGVPVTSASLSSYVEGIGELLEIRRGDRHSQTFDLSFDLSMHDIFVALANGATIVQPSAVDLLMPAGYIQRRRIDVWFSVPFLAHLAAGAAPDPAKIAHRMRLALFCGESLPADYARRFQVFMADDSETFNLYGPTEATIAFTGHRFSPENDSQPNVPIGWPFGSNSVAILDDEGRFRRAEPGVEGELLLAGPQVFEGYSPEVSDPFLVSDGTRYYRSGDRVTCGSSGLYHLCRTDLQLKLRGYRMEAAEIEAVCRKVLGLDQAVVLVVGDGQTARLVAAYVSAGGRDSVDPSALKEHLPHYMIPSEFVHFEEFPLNANSKVDRKKIAQHWS